MTSKREFQELEMSSLIYDPDFNCRKNLTVQSIATLSEAMDKAGLIHPILVQPWGKNKFKIIAGHRRYRAAKLLQWKTIWADIRTGLSPEEAHILNYTENLQRSDLNMVEEAQFLLQVYPDLGTPKQISLRECGRRIDQSVRWIQMRLRLLTLPKYIQEMFASGRLPKHTLDKLWHEKPAERKKLVKQLAKAIDPLKGVLDND
jgi:ParB family chromosome partitioning protein